MVNADMLQHGVVTLVALGALAVIARRVLGFVQVRDTRSGCPNCPSSKGACAPRVTPDTQPTTHPAVLVRSTPR